MNAQTITPAQLQNLTPAQMIEAFRDLFAAVIKSHGTFQDLTADEVDELFDNWNTGADGIYTDYPGTWKYFRIPAGYSVPDALMYDVLPGIPGTLDTYIYPVGPDTRN